MRPEGAPKNAATVRLAIKSKRRLERKVALTIAGFDPSNGAGVTADLQVFAAHGLFGVSAITALTVQSTLGVATVQPIQGEWLTWTLEHLEADLPAEGIKLGMLGSEAAVQAVVGFLRRSHSSGRRIPVVLDPILRSSSGYELLPAQAFEALQTDLLPLVNWITPNRAELGLLTGRCADSLEDARAAAEALALRYPELSIVVTGGEASEPIDLLRTPQGDVQTFEAPRVETSSTHGTGCAFSSALLARLMLGDAPSEAVAGAKAYVTQALRSAPGLGHGHGPLDLLWPLRGQGNGC